MKKTKVPHGTSFFNDELRHIPKSPHVRALEEMIDEDSPDLPIYLKRPPRPMQFDTYNNPNKFTSTRYLTPMEEELIERFYKWGKCFTYKPTINLIFKVFEDFGSIMFQLAIMCNTPDSRHGGQIVITHVNNISMYEFVAMDFDYFISWVYLQILRMERHEMDEFFKVKGVMIHDPHKNNK